MSNVENCIRDIEKALFELEARGDIVITSTIPMSVSKYIFHKAIESFIDSSDLPAALMECDIPYLLDQIRENVCATFSLDIEAASEIVNRYYQILLKRLSSSEVAQLIWHETPFEIGLLAYYCIELDRDDSRDLDYLNWRKSYYQHRHT